MTIKHPLTKAQENFIKKHKISEELLFDAQGNELSEDLKQAMSETNKVIAYNTTGCSKDDDHQFETIDGHCIQCETTRIAIALREHKTGYIYIGGSRKGKLIKIGCVSDAKDRIKALNMSKSKDAGFDDWEILFDAKTIAMGKTERMILQKLIDYKASYQHDKSGKLQNGGELYRCSYTKAKDAVTALQNEESFEFTQLNERRHITPDYQFKNLRAK